MTSMATIDVPKEYGYVLLTAASSYLLSIWLGVRIGPYRYTAKVAHPNVSVSPETIANAPSAEQKRMLYLFNCAQRGHQNFLENYPSALSGMLVTGLRYPMLSAAAGVVWMLGRVMCATGYTSASEKNVNGQGRWYGGGFWLAAVMQVGYMGLVGKMGWDLLGA